MIFPDSLFVDVVTLEDATFSYSSNSFCDNQTDPAPIISGVSGGTFSCNDANLVFVETGNNTGSSDGIIDLSAFLKQPTPLHIKLQEIVSVLVLLILL